MLASARSATRRSLDTLAGAAANRAARTCSRRSPPQSASSGSTARRTRAISPKSLRFAIATRFQELLRASASGLAALAVAGNATSACAAHRHRGADPRSGPRRDRARDRRGGAPQYAADAQGPRERRPIPKPGDRPCSARLRHARGGLEEERFFATVRRGYWAGAGGSPRAERSPQALIQTLEF